MRKEGQREARGGANRGRKRPERRFSRLHLVWISALGVTLALPSLTVELLLDDFVIKAYVTAFLSGESELAPWWYAGILMDGNPEVTIWKRSVSLLPWWTLPEVRIAFLRPVGVLSCVLDYALWPDAVWAMHLQSLAWYGGLCLLAGLFYRRLCGDGRIALLAALLYAVDDLHSTPAAWIANRNTTMAGCFGLLALLAHDRWRREGWRPGWWLQPLALLASLLSAEMGICLLAYYFAYALFYDRTPLRSRLLSLLPALSTVTVWQLAYNAFGFGSLGSGSYLDPVRHPELFLSELPFRLGWMSVWQFGLPISLLNRLQPTVSWLVLGAVLAVVGGGVLWLLLRRGWREAEIRFWGISSAAALIPLAASIPGERLLTLSGIGASALLAHLMVWSADAWRDAASEAVRRLGLFTAALTVLVHLVIASIFLSLDSYFVGRDFINMGFSVASVLGNEPRLADQDVVVVNAPNTLHGMMIPEQRRKHGLPVPGRTWILGSGNRERLVTRPDATTLELYAEQGYLLDPFAAHFRGPGHPFERGEEIELLNHTVTVEEVTDDGRPRRVRVRFQLPLEQPVLHFLVWDGSDYLRFPLPDIGQKVVIPPWPIGRTDIVRPPRLIER